MAVFSKPKWSEDGTYAHLTLTWQPKGGRPIVAMAMDCSDKLEVTKEVADRVSGLVCGEEEIDVDAWEACTDKKSCSRRAGMSATYPPGK